MYYIKKKHAIFSVDLCVCCVDAYVGCAFTSAMENLSSSSAGSGIGSRTGTALDRITASWLSILSVFPITLAHIHTVNTPTYNTDIQQSLSSRNMWSAITQSIDRWVICWRSLSLPLSVSSCLCLSSLSLLIEMKLHCFVGVCTWNVCVADEPVNPPISSPTRRELFSLLFVSVSLSPTDAVFVLLTRPFLLFLFLWLFRQWAYCGHRLHPPIHTCS